MLRRNCELEDPKLKDLYLACLAEIPLWRDVPRSKPKTPPQLFTPKDFDELYASRKDWQANKLRLVREPILDEWYAQTSRFYNLVEQNSPDGFHPFKSNMRRALAEHGVVLRQNEFPYQVPEDTAHNVLWFLKRISRQRRARYLSRLLYLDGLAPGDFLVIRNSPHLKSVPEFMHEHVYSRIKDNDGLGILTPFPSLVEVSMAFAGEPGYTLERAFRYLNKSASHAQRD